MSFKIDTKEKFTVITPELELLDANITVNLWEAATLCINSNAGNIIVNLQNVKEANAKAINDLASLQQHLNANQKSFVVCGLQPQVMAVVKNEDLADNLNITPTESEAWDVVQMEEIERELLSNDESSDQ